MGRLEDALTDRSDGKEDSSRYPAHTHGHRCHRGEGPGRQDGEADEHHTHKAPQRAGSPQTEQRCALDLVRVQRNRDKGQAGKRCAGTDRPDVKVTPRGRGAGIHWRRSVLLHAQRPAPRCVIDPPRPPRLRSLRRRAQPRILRRATDRRVIVVRRGTRVRRRDPGSDPRKRTVRAVAHTVAESVCVTKVAVAVQRACWVASSFIGSGYSRGFTSLREKYAFDVAPASAASRTMLPPPCRQPSTPSRVSNRSNMPQRGR